MFTRNIPYLHALESEVHVWLAAPGAVTDTACLKRYTAMLDTREGARWRRFRFEHDRRLFLVAHALLRRALSCYADVEPSDWRFAHGRYGRPEISAPRLPVRLRFNLSHTDGLAACVVALEDACGIDVERIDRPCRMRAIAAKVFAGPERHDLQALEGGEAYRERFMTYWTLREAWCKAQGTGLAHVDRAVWFEPGRGETVGVHGVSAHAAGGGHWHAMVRKPTAAHLLAVAVHCSGICKPLVSRFAEP